MNVKKINLEKRIKEKPHVTSADIHKALIKLGLKK